jgi:hypothetical protein
MKRTAKKTKPSKKPPVKRAPPVPAGVDIGTGSLDELFRARQASDGKSIFPREVAAMLKTASDELFWSMVRDGVFDDCTNGEVVAARSVANKFLETGFVIAACRYLPHLKDVSELNRLRSTQKTALVKGHDTQTTRKQDRERQAKTMLASGADVAEIAAALGVHPSTIYGYLEAKPRR